MRRRKREEEEPKSPELKNRVEALASSRARLAKIITKGVKLSILETVYSRAYDIKLREMPTRDLLQNLSGFAIHLSMPSLEESFNDLKVQKDCRFERLQIDSLYPVESLLVLYRFSLDKKRNDLGIKLAELWASVDRHQTRYGGEELEELKTEIENVQNQFDHHSLASSARNVSEDLLSNTHEKLSSLYRAFDIQMNADDGIMKLLFQVLKGEISAFEMSLLAEAFEAKVSFLVSFLKNLETYLAAGKFSQTVMSKNRKIHEDFNVLYYRAKFILELLGSESLPHYWASTKLVFENELKIYERTTWAEFRELDLVEASKQVDSNIKKLEFFKTVSNARVINVFLAKFKIMRGLLDLRCKHALRGSLENLSVRQLGDLLNDEIKLQEMQAQAHFLQNGEIICREIFQEFTCMFSELKRNLVIPIENAFKAEITRLEDQLNEFESKLSEKASTEQMLTCYWELNDFLTSINYSRSVYALGNFPSDSFVGNSLNCAFETARSWSKDLLASLAMDLCNKDLENLLVLLPLFQAKMSDWKPLFLHALKSLVQRLESENLKKLSEMESLHDLVGRFLQGNRGPRNSGRLFNLQPLSVNEACLKRMRFAQKRITSIHRCINFALHIAEPKEIEELLRKLERFRLGFEKMNNDHSFLHQLPEIAPEQLSKEEILAIQKNGACLSKVEAELKLVRPEYQKLFKDQNPEFDFYAAENLLTKIQNIRGMLANFSPIAEAEKAIEAISVLKKEHITYLCESYLPFLQNIFQDFNDELSVTQENLGKYLEMAFLAQIEPESPSKRSKSGAQDDEPSSPSQLSF